MLVTFIIPHKGRHELLKQTLDSVFALDFDQAQINAVVITQEESLSPQVLLSDPSANLEVLHRPKNETISALRNVGVANSESEYLAFLDADIELSKNWLKVMLEELGNKKADTPRIIVSAVQKSSENAPVLERIRTVLSNVAVDCDMQFLPGRNLFMRRASFEKIGGFPEHLVTCEDYYFTDKAHQLGALYYCSRADYIHLGEDKKLKEMFKKEIWRAQSNLHSINGRKIALNEVPSFLIPFWLAGFFVLCLVLSVLSMPVLALVSFLLMLLPVALYSLRLYSYAKREASFMDVLRFYGVYFPARVMGTFIGLVKVLRV